MARVLIETAHGHVFDHARPQWATGRWEGPEVIGGSFLELKVAGPSMLGIGRPDSHALPHITSSKMRRPRSVLLPARAGSFFHPERTLERRINIEFRNMAALVITSVIGLLP